MEKCKTKFDDETVDIDDYEIDDLVDCFDLTIPLDASEIIAKLDTYQQKFDSQPDFVNFIQEARAKLIKNIGHGKKNAYVTKNDNTMAGQVLDNENWVPDKEGSIPPNRKDMTRIVTQPPYNIMQRSRLNIPQQKPIEYVQGQLNPDLKNTFVRSLNIDSHYREILDISENLCFPPPGITGPTAPWKGQVKKNNIKLDTPSDFTFDLSEPLNNVEKIELCDAQIPRAWYVFDDAYGTNSFLYDTKKYTIPSGNYSAADLEIAINGAKNGLGALFSVVGMAGFDAYTNKMTFSPVGAGKTLTFYSDATDLSCNYIGGGGKRDYNLGWLLGFRQKFYTVPTGGSIIGEGLVDTFGTKYLYIMLDDFNKNRITYNLLGMTNNIDSFKVPSYYNYYTMGKGCTGDRGPKKKARECRNGTPALAKDGKEANVAALDTLTKAQQYTANSIIQSQNSKKSDRYFAPNNPNILAKIPIQAVINRDTSTPLFGQLSIDHSLIENNIRTYFGPVTIKRLHVQLLNDKGYVMNMNSMDWSMKLNITQLYQY
jgi:hypothetical protein